MGKSCLRIFLVGFCSDEDPFIVDGDGVLEIYDDYLKKNGTPLSGGFNKENLELVLSKIED